MSWLVSTWYGILTIVLLSLLLIFLLSLIPVLYRKFFKRFYDFTLSLIAIVCLSPIFLILIPAVAIGMKGNPFFTQQRPGKNEKIFKMIKFRSMTNEKDKDGNLLPDEVRLTKFGKFLRSTSLDELPELFNIIIGNMSIVGPRPLMTRYLEFYKEDERKRHNVRPGLSGYAQVHGRNNVDWDNKIKMDIYYVEHISLIMDIKIIFDTILIVLKREGVSVEDMMNFDDFRKKQYETKKNDNSLKFKTPYYVIHEQELDENFKKLKAALEKHWKNYIIGYSYKTNSLPWVIKHFDKLGCYAETVSDDEYNLAKYICVEKSHIIYNGPVKTKASFLEALKNGCIVNIDSQREVDWLEDIGFEKRKVGIRINFDIEKMCPGQSQCPEDGGRFGFCYENGELSKVIKKLQDKKVKISGIHLHTSSKSRSLDIYRTIAEIACKIQKEFNLALDYVDVGGGFFGGLPMKPQFDEYIALMESILSTCFDKTKTKLIVEPGMAVIGSPISYVTSVIDVKDTGYNRFVVTDGTRTSIDPLMTKKSYFHRFDIERQRETYPKQIICGYTCMEHDRLFVEINGPMLQYGDQIIYDKVGAYTMSLTPLFIKYFPDVYVESNGNVKKIRSAWTYNEYVQHSELE